MKPIVVVGSINWDISVQVPHLPVPGETVAGGEALSGLGGKGANQAIAAARAGGKIHLIGALGQDAFGDLARKDLEAEGIELHLVQSNAPTGIALIGVDAKGQNSIMISAGANGTVKPEDFSMERFAGADFALMQLELPLQSVQAAIRAAKQAGTKVVLNASPISENLNAAHLAGVDVLVVNEVEAGQLLEMPRAQGRVQAFGYARRLNQHFPQVVITLGADGAVCSSGEGDWSTTGHTVSVIDTTGAGDALVGALTVALSGGDPLSKAVAFANAAGALATTQRGASTSPNRLKILELLGASHA